MVPLMMAPVGFLLVLGMKFGTYHPPLGSMSEDVLEQEVHEQAMKFPNLSSPRTEVWTRPLRLE